MLFLQLQAKNEILVSLLDLFEHPGMAYLTNHSQLKWSTRVTCTCGVTHTPVCVLDSTRVYTHTQYYTLVYVCMATVAIADY